MSSFLFAAQEGYTDCVKELLSYPSVDVNEKNSTGWTALHAASQAGHLETVKLLINSPNIIVQPKDKDGIFFFFKFLIEFHFIQLLKMVMMKL